MHLVWGIALPSRAVRHLWRAWPFMWWSLLTGPGPSDRPASTRARRLQAELLWDGPRGRGKPQWGSRGILRMPQGVPAYEQYADSASSVYQGKKRPPGLGRGDGHEKTSEGSDQTWGGWEMQIKYAFSPKVCLLMCPLFFTWRISIFRTKSVIGFTYDQNGEIKIKCNHSATPHRTRWRWCLSFLST